MNNRLVCNDTDQLKAILEQAFAGIANPLEAKGSAWSLLERAITEAYSLGAAKSLAEGPTLARLLAPRM